MSENHFRSHFWPFQTNTKLFFLTYKMAAGAHFGCPKITFDRISGHFRSICNFFFDIFDIMAAVHFGCPKLTFEQLYFFGKFLTKWLSSAILDVRKSHSIAFLAISDRYATIFNVHSSKFLVHILVYVCIYIYIYIYTYMTK